MNIQQHQARRLPRLQVQCIIKRSRLQPLHLRQVGCRDHAQSSAEQRMIVNMQDRQQFHHRAD